MTPSSKQNLKTFDRDDKDRPLSKAEIAKILAIFLIYPFLVGPLLLIGGYTRTAPNFPPLWFGFWMTVCTLPICFLLSITMLYRYPRIVRERMSKKKPDETDSQQERRYYKTTTIFFFTGFFLMAWDGVVRHETFPKLLNILGSTLLFLSFILIAKVLQTNKYAARVVYVQKGQELIETGPYSIVRHPMYSCLIPMFWGLPLCAGSFWAVIPMSLIIVWTGYYRIADEEAFLVQTFGSKYEEYQQKVRYKMIPFLF